MKIYREEESRRLVKTLQRQLLEVKKEKESEIQVCKNFSLNYFTTRDLQTYLSDYIYSRGVFLENQLLLKLLINCIILMTITFDSRENLC